MDGSHKLVIGPKLQRLLYANIRFADHFTASSGEYLEIDHLNGKTEHLEGPCCKFFNSVEHRSIKLRKALSLSGRGQGLVVYNGHAGDGVGKDPRRVITRDFISGPLSFVPTVQQRVHDFDWGDGKFQVLSLQQKLSNLLK